MSTLRRYLYIPLLLIGCAPATKVVLPPVSPPVAPTTIPQPTFEKTFGEISVGSGASLTIRYKSMTLLIDPTFDSMTSANLSPQTDYVLLTDSSQRHFGAGTRVSLRKDIKIIGSSEESDKLKKEGFTAVKGLGSGQRVMLKKENDFLFVNAVANRHPKSNLQVNSYLLEFDNGKNIFISGDVSNIDGLREFVYSLRDDGKEVTLGFFYRQPEADDAALAQLISLIQPKNALLTQPSSSAPKFNDGNFREALKTELFEGPYLVLEPGKQIPF